MEDMVVWYFYRSVKIFRYSKSQNTIKKLEPHGVRGAPLNWFESCPYQYIMVPLMYCKITCGIPKGSVPGPLLFFNYINDLPNISEQPSHKSSKNLIIFKANKPLYHIVTLILKSYFDSQCSYRKSVRRVGDSIDFFIISVIEDKIRG